MFLADLNLVHIGLILLFVLFITLGIGVWISIALLGIGWFGISLFSNAPAVKAMATVFWSSSASWTLAALPLFIWMGEILFRTRLSENLFRGVAPWVAWLPGRLFHVNVVACGVFAAVSGSSAATVATIGKMSLPELEKRGYDRRMSLGSLAGSATLGFMIPPSLIMIVYGVTAEVSLVRLYLAGVGPGVLIMVLYSGYIISMSLIRPGIVPAEEQKFTWKERISAGRELLPILLLMLAVMGVLYLGVATATEAAAGGVIGALFVAAISRCLTWESFKASLMGTTTLSCMICFILAGASFLTSAMAYTGVPRAFAQWIVEMQLHPYVLMAALCVVYTILGCFIDSMSMIVLTLPVVLPIIVSIGYDPVWFGVFMVVMSEIAQVTPPLGFNLFVLQGMTKLDIFEIARSALAFCILLILAAAIITIFPGVVLWLPSKSLGT